MHDMIKNFFFIFISVLLLSSCSRLNLALRWADFVVAEYADDFFDLNSEQKKQVRSEVNQFISEGKNEEFQNISKTLENLATELEKINASAINTDFFSKYQNQLQQHWNIFFQKLSPHLGKLSLNVTPEQWKYFLNETEKEIAKQKAEKADLTEDQKTRSEKIIDNFEFWLDDLTKEQQNLITQFVTTTPYDWNLHWNNRLNLAKKISSLDQSKEDRKNLIEKVSSDFTYTRDLEYLNQQKIYREKLSALSISLLQKMTKEQQSHLIRQLRKQAKAFAMESK